LRTVSQGALPVSMEEWMEHIEIEGLRIA